MRTLLIGIGVLALLGCSSLNDSSKVTSLTMQSYFETYRQRSDFNGFMDFYADDVVVQDIVYGNELAGKSEVKAFFDWNRGQFELLDGKDILTITRQTLEAQTVVTEGYFHRFRFNDQTLGPWRFVMIHELDDDSKIIKQVDWINYTPRENFLGGLDMNEGLSE
ncbi:MAG: hypothetical protein CL693_00135 [Cellvibrionaceae bacterium]|nr:hypothetical protein [Cellvibrionaceae bacterium]